jgi:predicted metal-binding membrane protein
MGLLFAFGVMNLLWVGGISAFVLLGKITPANQLVSRLSGLLFIGWATWIVFGAVKLAALQLLLKRSVAQHTSRHLRFPLQELVA